MKFRGSKLINWAIADLLFLVHGIVILVLLFSWFYPPLLYVHGVMIMLTLLSWLLTGACVLAVWEFNFRKKAKPALQHKDEYAYMHHYLSIFISKPPSVSFMKKCGYVYLYSSLFLWTLDILNDFNGVG